YRWAENQYDRLPALAAESAAKPVTTMTPAQKPLRTGIDHGTIRGRSCVDCGHYKPLSTSVDRILVERCGPEPFVMKADFLGEPSICKFPTMPRRTHAWAGNSSASSAEPSYLCSATGLG